MKIIDATPMGKQLHAFNLAELNERMSVRDIIRSRIYQEVTDFNQKGTLEFNGLVQPTNAERTLNGYRLKTRKVLDWQDQFAKALAGFEGNGFFVLVGERQAETLDEMFEVGPETEVSFVKLMPLVGG